MNETKIKRCVNADTVLAEGIKILCGSDEDIDRLITPRCKEIIILLERYVKEVEFFNPAYGLVGAGDTNELVIKHILDSIAPAGLISRLLKTKNKDTIEKQRQSAQEYSIADIGSGAGLPGIPLAVILNDCSFTLIERMGRRAGFLLNTQAALELSNITVEECELEMFAKKQFSGGFDLITFRAFKPLDPGLLKTMLKILKPGGIIAAYKGRRKKIESEMAPYMKTEYTLSSCLEWEALPCPVPFLDEERHLLVIKK